MATLQQQNPAIGQYRSSAPPSGLRRLFMTGDWYRYLILTTVVFFMFLPFILMIMISFKDNPQFNHSQYSITFPLHPENYTDAWKIVSRYIGNSIVVAAASTIGMVPLAALAAWAFARYPFPGREILFFLVLALLMVPGELTLI